MGFIHAESLILSQVIDNLKLDLHIGRRPCRNRSTPDEIEIMKGRKRGGCLYDKPFQERVDIVGAIPLWIGQNELDRKPRETIGFFIIATL